MAPVKKKDLVELERDYTKAVNSLVTHYERNKDRTDISIFDQFENEDFDENDVEEGKMTTIAEKFHKFTQAYKPYVDGLRDKANITFYACKGIDSHRHSRGGSVFKTPKRTRRTRRNTSASADDTNHDHERHQSGGSSLDTTARSGSGASATVVSKTTFERFSIRLAPHEKINLKRTKPIKMKSCSAFEKAMLKSSSKDWQPQEQRVILFEVNSTERIGVKQSFSVNQALDDEDIDPDERIVFQTLGLSPIRLAAHEDTVSDVTQYPEEMDPAAVALKTSVSAAVDIDLSRIRLDEEQITMADDNAQVTLSNAGPDNSQRNAEDNDPPSSSYFAENSMMSENVDHEQTIGDDTIDENETGQIVPATYDSALPTPPRSDLDDTVVSNVLAGSPAQLTKLKANEPGPSQAPVPSVDPVQEAQGDVPTSPRSQEDHGYASMNNAPSPAIKPPPEKKPKRDKPPEKRKANEPKRKVAKKTKWLGQLNVDLDLYFAQMEEQGSDANNNSVADDDTIEADSVTSTEKQFEARIEQILSRATEPEQIPDSETSIPDATITSDEAMNGVFLPDEFHIDGFKSVVKKWLEPIAKIEFDRFVRIDATINRERKDKVSRIFMTVLHLANEGYVTLDHGDDENQVRCHDDFIIEVAKEAPLTTDLSSTDTSEEELRSSDIQRVRDDLSMSSSDSSLEMDVPGSLLSPQLN